MINKILKPNVNGKSKEIVISGWKRSDIFDNFPKGSRRLPSLDPFDVLRPLHENSGFSDTLPLSVLSSAS